MTLVTFVASLMAPIAAQAQSVQVANAEQRAPAPQDVAPNVPTAQAPAQNGQGASPSGAPTVQNYVAPPELAAAKRWLQEAYGQAREFGDDVSPDDAEQADRAAGAAEDDALLQDRAGAASPGGMKQVASPSGAPTLLANDLPTASTASVTGKTISVPKGGGTIQGMEESFSAQLSTGIATYSIPFALPQTRGDAQPTLGLSYSSSGGFGVAGVGWSLDLPFIARQTDRGPPKYADTEQFDPNQDRFVFNGGQELVPICVIGPGNGCAWNAPFTAEAMPNWGAGWTYFRPRVEGSYMRFFWSPDHLTWRVQFRKGQTMEFGVPSNGQNDHNPVEENPNPRNAGAPEIFRWLPVRFYDLSSSTDPTPPALPNPWNVTRYVYTELGGAKYLSDIYYTPSPQNPSQLQTRAHHVRLRYETRPDSTFSYRSGWRIDQTVRLAGVDVTVKPFTGSSSLPRQILRRYHLRYDPTSHASLLTSVTVEGRCANSGQAQVLEDASERLPEVTNCPTLPPMTFEYSHVDGHLANGATAGSTLAGYEPFDERVRNLSGSPPYSLDAEQTAVHDVNGDALPDVLVTAPGFFSGNHGVYFNGANAPESFKADTIALSAVNGANANTITLGNANVVPLDIDGNALVDLVHMPMVKTYSVYSPELQGSRWIWQGRSVTTPDGLSPKIDFGRDASHIKVVDVDFDGLVDVVRTTGTQLETYLSLGRLPGGFGRFGQGRRTGTETAELSTAPFTSCVPWSGTAVSFGDKDTQLADMNGDGIVDIVRLRRGQIRYWPGRGNGFWGTGSLGDCPANSFGQGRDILMEDSPFYSDIQGNSLRLEDVNGDGLSDLVQVRFQDVDVWLNVDGVGWTQSHSIHDTPASPSFADRVRLVDINGSGTPDILWGDASNYRYIDLSGGERPGVLVRVDNGLGKSTTLEYAASTSEMLAAKAAGKAWPRGMPIVTHVVKRVTVSDNLTVAGRPPSADVTEYTYAEPVYDGRQREFRGFRSASARRVGDANSPAETTDTTFLLGECVDETPTNGVDDCAEAERWRDNPREALKGVPVLTETRNDQGVYLSTVNTHTRLRQIFKGMDGRHVRATFPVNVYTALYDSTAPFTSGSPASHTAVDLQLVSGGPATVLESVLAPRRQSGTSIAILQKQIPSMNTAGMPLTEIDFGCTSGAGSACAAFVQETRTRTNTVIYANNPGHWLFLEMGGNWRGDNPIHALAYDNVDRPTLVTNRPASERRFWQLVFDLVRTQSDSAYFPPRTSVAGGWLNTHTFTWDFSLNLILDQGTNGRCRRLTYDTQHVLLPTSEIVYPAGCNSTGFTTTAVYDRGFAAPTAITDPTGQTTTIKYDQFGRVIEITKPNPGSGTPVPSTKIEYYLPAPGGPAYSRIRTLTQDGDNPTIDSYHEAWSFVDGLGRTVATVTEAENGKWVVSGLTDYDNKGAVRKKYNDYFVDSVAAFTPSDPPPGSTPGEDVPLCFGTQNHDAFGRPLVTTDCGIATASNVYHALATDRYDAEDLKPGGAHEGTYVTELKDGLGRVVRTTERFWNSGVMDSLVTTVEYTPVDKPEVIRRTRQSTGAQTSRYMVYDTQGHLVMTGTPDTGLNYTLPSGAHPNRGVGGSIPTGDKIRYRYNDAGDMVGISDARGCGANFFYDGLGRLLREDYFPCAAWQTPYSLPDPTTGPPTSGIEVLYEYDAPSAAAKPNGWSAGTSNGRLVRVQDQSSHTLFSYDARGRIVQTALQVAKPGASADNVLANRYTPRWYLQTQSYDAADRPVTQSTGAATSVGGESGGTDTSVLALLGAGSASTVTNHYGPGGALDSVSSSYDYGASGGGNALVKGGTDAITRTADGLVKSIRYGDAASTQTANHYDNRRRLDFTTTFRSPLASWPTNGLDTFQQNLAVTSIAYDLVSNPIAITDERDESEWPSGSKPVTRTVPSDGYDDFYRLTKINYTYSNGSSSDDTWVSPFANEDQATSSGDPQAQIDSRRAIPSPHLSFTNRTRSQTFAYDHLGNTTNTTDDQNAFYDRSLGSITNGTADAGPHQLKRATITTGSNTGTLTAQYDAAGNMVSLYLDRNGSCIPSGNCAQVFKYEYDELNRLQRARRWDMSDVNPDANPLPTVNDGDEIVDLRYRYDADDNRVIKWAHDPVSGHAVEDAYTLYVFDTLDVRRAQFNTTASSNEYELTSQTEVPYLFANGVRFGRVVYEEGIPASDPNSQHVFFELGDHLGSTSTVLDKRTGELVEKGTYQAYGGTESDFRPGRWADFREDWRFTGKEEDVEVGLVYFGKRYLNPLLGRWVTADPLGLHSAGEADLNLYAYVRGMALKAVDPRGLVEQTVADKAAEKTWVANYMSNRSRAPATGGGSPEVKPAAPAATTAQPRPGNSVMQKVLVGAALANAETPDAIKINDVNASAKGIPGGRGPVKNGSIWAQIAYLGATAGSAVVGAAISVGKGAASAARVVGEEAAKAFESGMRRLSRAAHDGASMATSEALDAAAAHLGSGYKQVAPGVYKSADGTKMVRMTDADLARTGNHAGDPHMNFETGQTVTKPNGKESFRTDPGGNAHVFLPEEK